MFPIPKLLAKEGAFTHSFIHSHMHSFPHPCPPATLGIGAKMNRTQQCLGEGDCVPVLGLQAYFRSSPRQGCVGQGFAPFLSQIRTVELLMMMEAWQFRAQRAPGSETHRGLLSPPSSLCHLLSSMRRFNLELSQGEGGQNIRGHLSSP